MIEIRNLTLKYNENIIFENINLNVKRGDYLAIIGENGSGKSSFIKCILDIKKPTSGEILINGKNVQDNFDWTKVGYVAQKYDIAHDIPITVKEYLKLFTKNSKILKDLIKDFELEKILNKPINKLSGGQFQRVNIAKSVINNIEYLILDEPNTGLDYKSREKLYKLLHKLNEKGLTIIIISHTLEEFKDKIHKIYNMESHEMTEVSKNVCRYC